MKMMFHIRYIGRKEVKYLTQSIINTLKHAHRPLVYQFLESLGQNSYRNNLKPLNDWETRITDIHLFIYLLHLYSALFTQQGALLCSKKTDNKQLLVC